MALLNSESDSDASISHDTAWFIKSFLASSAYKNFWLQMVPMFKDPFFLIKGLDF